MKRLTKYFTLCLASVALASCASQLRSDVSSWHQLQRPSGETFVIVAKDGAKRGSIEFAHYAEMISQQLQRIGYNAARSSEQPQLVVRIDYGISDGRSQVRSYGGYGHFGYGHYGYYGHPWGYGYGYPHYYNDVRSYTVYTRRLEMEIAPASNNAVNLFESKVISDGRNNRLQEVMPYLVEAMFQDFPGPSGVTRRVTVDIEKSSAARPAGGY